MVVVRGRKKKGNERGKGKERGKEKRREKVENISLLKCVWIQKRKDRISFLSFIWFIKGRERKFVYFLLYIFMTFFPLFYGI